MGNKELHIIPMPLLLMLFLEKYQFKLSDVVTAEMIEDLLKIAKSKLHNTSGVIDVSDIFTTLKSTRMIINHLNSYEITNMAEIVSSDILSLLVLHNIHNKLYYVVNVTPTAIYLQTYDDQYHSR